MMAFIRIFLYKSITYFNIFTSGDGKPFSISFTRTVFDVDKSMHIYVHKHMYIMCVYNI